MFPKLQLIHTCLILGLMESNLVPMHQNTRRHIPKDRYINSHCHENLKSQNFVISVLCSFLCFSTFSLIGYNLTASGFSSHKSIYTVYSNLCFVNRRQDSNRKDMSFIYSPFKRSYLKKNLSE
jgi:hypothetical protein